MARTVQSSIFAIAGVAGILVILATLAPALGYSIVRLETGSMAPGYPAGSVLLVRDTPAEELAVGDIVTVSRAGHSPVTHRIVGAEPAGEGARLVLRGDANASADPEPYLVTRAGLVMAGVPFGGELLVALASPAGIVALSVLASLLVLWAWWPRAEDDGPSPRYRRRTSLDPAAAETLETSALTGTLRGGA